MTALDQFKSWLHSHSAKPYLYHTGFLMRDRQADKELADLARAVWLAQCRGRVSLVQRRVSAGVFQYMAVKRRKR